jgi:sulfatase modifying factor 1
VSLRPNGYLDGCVSAFGVRDLHGSVATWTSSQWRRPSAGERELSTVRGGTGGDGALTSRCASGRGLPPSARRPDVGVRCCAGEANVFEVVLSVSTAARPLTLLPPTPALAAALEPLAGDALGVVPGTRLHERHEAFVLERAWLWSPLAGEQLVLGGGCAASKRGGRGSPEPLCGVLVARPDGAVAPDGSAVPRLSALLFASSGHWQPRLHLAAGAPPHPHRRLELVGADARGAFVTTLSFDWGRVAAGQPDRSRVRRPD